MPFRRLAFNPETDAVLSLDASRPSLHALLQILLAAPTLCRISPYQNTPMTGEHQDSLQRRPSAWRRLAQGVRRGSDAV